MNWRKGPPPSIGWWPASGYRNPNVYRWWNGKWWSCAAHSVLTAKEAASQAARKEGIRHIEWTDRPAWWPNRSKT